MKHVKKIFGAVTVIALGYCAWWSGMNYVGYCHKEGRFLTDEEKIDSAIQKVLASYPPSVSKYVEANINGSVQRVKSWYVPEHAINYKNNDEFRSINPNCCELSMVIADGVTASFIDRIFGKISTFVILRYKVRYWDNDKVDKYNDAGQAVAINNCGRAW